MQQPRLTTDAFRRMVDAEGFRPDAYDIDGSGDRNECYVCTSTTDGWHVFYAERGFQRQSQQFPTQGDALEHLLATVRADPTTRRRAP